MMNLFICRKVNYFRSNNGNFKIIKIFLKKEASQTQLETALQVVTLRQRLNIASETY